MSSWAWILQFLGVCLIQEAANVPNGSVPTRSQSAGPFLEEAGYGVTTAAGQWLLCRAHFLG